MYRKEIITTLKFYAVIKKIAHSKLRNMQLSRIILKYLQNVTVCLCINKQYYLQEVGGKETLRRYPITAESRHVMSIII